jgi:hypothetical protein
MIPHNHCKTDWISWADFAQTYPLLHASKEIFTARRMRFVPVRHAQAQHVTSMQQWLSGDFLLIQGIGQVTSTL